ncbi:MAG: nucleotide exchange factor GrpE [Flavobacteriales bacterium]|jgi:molecular chaperone GrpE|nr:nucleotide exchange factor GrpE [Flavobacteriales bacterium]
MKVENEQVQEEQQDNIAEESQEETTAQEETIELSETEKLQAEVQELKDKHMRLYAEFENFRRRSQKEKLDLISNGGVDMVKNILPVLDDYERANKALTESDDLDEIKKGQELIQAKLIQILENKGLKAMEDTIGKTFDTDFHEAVTQIPAPTEEMKGKVIDQLETGYFFNEKVLRYAKVVVGQ